MAKRSSPEKPLEGLRVVDLSRFIAGPYCGYLLGELGAEVIKVEKPGGEDSRHVPPAVQGVSLYTAVFNRGKKSVTINFRDPRSKPLLEKLFSQADIVVENFRPGTMKKMGFGFERLQELNPRVILTSVSGFGQTGPMAHRAGFDAIGQAMGGLMQMTGAPDHPPLLSGTFVVDYSTALFATIATLGALRHRDMTGEGRHVDVALLDSAASLLVTALPEADLLGRDPERVGNRDRYAAPVNAYQAQDGWIYLAAANQGLWTRLVEVMKAPELLEDPRFATTMLRVENVDALDNIVGAWVAKHTVAECVQILEDAQVPSGPVRKPSELLNDPQLQARQQLLRVTDRVIGPMVLPGSPLRLQRDSEEAPGPQVGEHNEQIYGGLLGLSEGELERLAAEGVI